jgi:hypothetical protein
VCLALVCKQPKVTMSLLIILTSLAWTSSFLLVDATTVLLRFFVQLSLLVLWMGKPTGRRRQLGDPILSLL